MNTSKISKELLIILSAKMFLKDFTISFSNFISLPFVVRQGFWKIYSLESIIK